MNVVILNDTRADMHHGCSRVMRLLEEGLERHGLTISARSPVRHDWQSDATLRTAIAGASLIVINGEGTLHHGSRHAARLLAVTDVAGDTPVALVNALYQDNPPEWAKWLHKLSYIATRDSRSAAEIARLTGKTPTVIPDLSMSERITKNSEPSTLVFGDSVEADVTTHLADLARGQGMPLVPSVSVLKRSKGRTAIGRALRNLWIKRHLRRAKVANPTLDICTTEGAYASRIAAASLYVTGRFHGVCYALAAGTPFVAVKSNSWKIEALVADAGLAPWRVMALDNLDKCLARGPDHLAFDPAERAALARFLDGATAGAEKMFADLGTLAAGHSKRSNDKVNGTVLAESGR